MKKLGFIGAGNMAGALVKGIINSGTYKASELFLSDPNKANLENLHKTYGVNITGDNNELIADCETVILAVKPQMAAAVLGGLNYPTKMPLIISIMAGLTTAKLESLLPANTRVVRSMPNTPALVQKGATGICAGKYATAEDMKTAEAIFAATGLVVSVNESQIDAVCGVSGSGPAYFFMIIEALSDAGVKAGLPREVSLKLAAQTAEGAAKMILDMGKHPSELKDMVTSPGGTTIAALSVLEDYGLRAALISAVDAAVQRSKELAD